jgi:hypothetical protein
MALEVKLSTKCFLKKKRLKGEMVGMRKEVEEEISKKNNNFTMEE